MRKLYLEKKKKEGAILPRRIEKRNKKWERSCALNQLVLSQWPHVGHACGNEHLSNEQHSACAHVDVRKSVVDAFCPIHVRCVSVSCAGDVGAMSLRCPPLTNVGSLSTSAGMHF